MDAPTLPEEAFLNLFDGLREGVYIGLVGSETTATFAANPYLRLIIGWADDVPAADLRPFDLDRFVDPLAREGFLSQLRRDGAVQDHLLRLRRIDGTAVWMEVTARAEAIGDALRIEAVMRDVTDRKKLEDQSRDVFHQLSQA
jgi:PAS domain-containing protein